MWRHATEAQIASPSGIQRKPASSHRLLSPNFVLLGCAGIALSWLAYQLMLTISNMLIMLDISPGNQVELGLEATPFI